MPTAKHRGRAKLTISNPEKLLYPAAKFRKIDVVEYYAGVAPFLLPHFKNRPVTLKRYPEGVHGEFFYEKDAPSFTPEWVKTFPVPRHEGGPDIQYILINDVRTLGWCANMPALELHPFLHVAPRIGTPTMIVFDLDPGENTDVFNCIEVAFLLRDLLANLRLKCFAKVSGSKGIQIYVPLNTPTGYEATQPFARAVAEMLEREHPKLIVSDMAKNLRVGKVFIDWSQNADHKTTVGVYSLRAKRERPYVSMPVRWNEFQRAAQKNDKDALSFAPAEALHRLSKVGDLFAPVLRLKQALPAEFARRATAIPKGKTPNSLAEYDAKRNFGRTTEPGPEAPRRSRQGGRRRFVVQKHAASHLHYDFRLEMHDVLKSWAVPRGLPTKSAEVRSAFETEDHPIDYLEFEGVIPEGQYGGGTVMVWDIGTYDVVDGNYWKGGLTVFLTGKKLKGEWMLKRTDEENGKTKWLVTKTSGIAKPIGSKRKDASVISGRTMEQIARERSAVWQSDRATTAEQPPPSGKTRTSMSERVRPKVQLKFVPPMKATAVDKLPAGAEWLYEVKWDGYRALALKSGDDVRLLSLKNKSLSADFPSVVDAVHGVLAEAAIIDGEIVAVSAEGKPSFQVLQNRKSLGRGWLIVYYAFDLLQVDDDDVKRLPLRERKARLRELLGDSGVRYSAELSGNPEAIVASIQQAGLEGVVAKRGDSVYQARTRSVDWLKLRLGHQQEFVIGGYNPDGETFQSLLVGYYEGAKLIFAGKVRQGFNPSSRRKLLETLEPLRTGRCPFANLPSSKKSHFGEGVTAEDMKKLRWLRPKLVAQVRFAEWTTYGLLRHATYLGLRSDKSAREVSREP